MYEFLTTDPETIRSELTDIYMTVSGTTSAPAVGSDADLLISFLAFAAAAERQERNEALSKNFISYAQGEDLDRIGIQFTGRARGNAAKARTTLRFSTGSAAAADIAVPAGTRATADGKIFFATTADCTIEAGQTSADAAAECTLAGSFANGIPAGGISRIADTLPNVSGVTNTEATYGGADIETDEEYRRSLRASYGALSNAGSEAGYLYWAKEASAAVSEASVDTDGEGTVLIYLTPPSQDLADEVQQFFDGMDEKGMTDLVEVAPASVVGFHANVRYTVSRADRQREEQIDRAVEAAAEEYLKWQCGHLGRGINTDRLKQLIYNAGADTVLLYQAFAQSADSDTPVLIVNDDNKTNAYATFASLGKNVTVGILAGQEGVTIAKES